MGYGSDKQTVADNLLYYKEDISAVTGRTIAPSAAFAFNEKNMVAALGDYLKKSVAK